MAPLQISSSHVSSMVATVMAVLTPKSQRAMMSKKAAMKNHRFSLRLLQVCLQVLGMMAQVARLV